jgi:nickel transport protein
MNVRLLTIVLLAAALVLATAAATPAQTVSAPARQDLSAADPAAQQTPVGGPQPAPQAEGPTAREAAPAAASPLPAGIDKALEKALDRKLAPIMRTLAEMQEQKVRLTDVLGGLGYIFGLVGVAAYFKARGRVGRG